MAELLTRNPPNRGISDGIFSSNFKGVPEEGGHWYMSRKEIEENSPSRRDGIDLRKETNFRKSYCTLLQDLGMRLKVPQVTIATAIIFCHRFFLRQSHARNDRRTIATVCMFLAGKVEETPRPLKDVILVSYEIIHKKDPAAVQNIKRKEVYEQQKELILIGERVVLATLDFDFIVHHPYKPLVEAMKRFQSEDSLAQVAGNVSLAQVAWNFVNDGLRTSLCLQFKPHHIAAGAIFLAAKFLKVKLPSDGEVVWWQEFDVTPRQLEEISNQMLELYEQNRVLPSQGSEVERNTSGGLNHKGPTKTPVANGQPSLANGHSEAERITAKQSSHRPAPDNATANNHGEFAEDTQNRSGDSGISESDMGSVITEQKVDGEASGRYESFPDRIGWGNKEEHAGRDGGATSTLKREDNVALNKWKRGAGGQSMNKSPGDGMIDKDKVKAALEKRRKSHGEVMCKKELVDEEDLIHRELEDGVESAAAAAAAAAKDEMKRESRQSWSKTEDPWYATSKDQEQKGDGTPVGMEVEDMEEGEMVDEVSPKLSNRKRKERSPPDCVVG